MSFEGYMLAIELPFLLLLYYIFIYKYIYNYNYSCSCNHIYNGTRKCGGDG